ncbi:MAG: hypothetical protein H6851_05270 [Geminicoccaceae bacterium]|nr:hypothetical protein [Geminicoccaceae bacterium]
MFDSLPTFVGDRLPVWITAAATAASAMLYWIVNRQAWFRSLPAIDIRPSARDSQTWHLHFAIHNPDVVPFDIDILRIVRPRRTSLLTDSGREPIELPISLGRIAPGSTTGHGLLLPCSGASPTVSVPVVIDMGATRRDHKLKTGKIRVKRTLPALG